jgi:hypothetical protein
MLVGIVMSPGVHHATLGEREGVEDLLPRPCCEWSIAGEVSFRGYGWKVSVQGDAQSFALQVRYRSSIVRTLADHQRDWELAFLAISSYANK